ncbi:MAG: gamma-glutamylcyclotransferase [Clostridia bacterium]|nr:gamma-glutamylcyclotransferase [Clostridia bacterium]
MKINRRTLYLAYGSNLHTDQMSLRCPGAKVIGTATLKDYRLLFRGGRHGAVATVEPCEGKSVPVLLWGITEANERSLDIYEGWPRLYRKEYVPVTVDGKQRMAMMYVMTDGRELGEPSPGYYGTIAHGYKDFGFDLAVLEQAVKDSIAVTPWN